MDWVEEVLRRYRLDALAITQRVIRAWEDSVGDRIGHLSRAERFGSGCLTIAVVTPSLATELGYLKPEYLQRVNSALGEPLVVDLRFKPGHFPPITSQGLPPSTQAARAEARCLFKDNKDPVSRRSFERLYLTLSRRETAILARGGRRCPRCGVAFREEGEICPGCRFGAIADETGWE